MATIRNIAKRRQLAEMVYSSHTAKAYELTREEKDELGNEVGAAFKGYVQAIEDIACLFMQGKPIGDIKDFICEQLNGSAEHNLFTFTEHS